MKTITKNRIAILMLMMSIFATRSNAQQDPLMSRYMFNGMIFNPAYAGSHDYASYGALFRKQWVGFDGAPMTSAVWADIPFTKKNIGLGVNLGYDKIGATEQTDFNVNFAYHLKTSRDTKLSFALRSGMKMYKSNLGDVTVWDENDPHFYNTPLRFLPNFGFGTYFYSKNYFAGLAIPNIISYDNDNVLSTNPGTFPKLVRHFYFNSGYVFNTTDKIDIKPSLLMRYTANAPAQLDCNLQVYYKKVVSLGVSYRTNDGLVFMAEILSVPKWRFGYAYDMSLTKLRNYNSGSHEIMIAYDIRKRWSHSVRFF